MCVEEDTMKVFFSWSGRKSCYIAEQFKDLLENIYYDINVYYSKEGIGAGSKWRDNIEEGLNNNDLGMIFLTESNLSSKWIYFEAGALSKSMETNRIIPILYELNAAQISEPLAAFQSKTLSKEDVKNVVLTINELSENKVPNERIIKSFDAYWGIWEKKLKEVEEINDDFVEDISDGNVMNEDQKIDEILRIMRSQQVNRNNSDNMESNIHFGGLYYTNEELNTSIFGSVLLPNIQGEYRKSIIEMIKIEITNCFNKTLPSSTSLKISTTEQNVGLTISDIDNNETRNNFLSFRRLLRQEIKNLSNREGIDLQLAWKL